MRRALLLLGALALAGCGSAKTVTRTVTVKATPAPSVCEPALGHGVMGACTPSSGVRRLAAPRRGARLIPDVSEWQACALHSEAIYRVYEAGTGRQDSTARCHALELRRLGVWSAVYFFERAPGYGAAGSCPAQARRFVAIARSMPYAPRLYVIDAETYLPGGCVTATAREVAALTHAPVVTYTSTGTWPGGALTTPWWAASYGARPGCIGSTCRHVAWQFSSSFSCRGVYGDCSIDEGILGLGLDRAALEARRRALRRVLAAYGCRRRVRQHEALGPRCQRWFREGDEVNARLAAA